MDWLGCSPVRVSGPSIHRDRRMYGPYVATDEDPRFPAKVGRMASARLSFEVGIPIHPPNLSTLPSGACSGRTACRGTSEEGARVCHECSIGVEHLRPRPSSPQAMGLRILHLHSFHISSLIYFLLHICFQCSMGVLVTRASCQREPNRGHTDSSSAAYLRV